ncbi:MAG TPA: metal ABC transporter permease, partial [Brevundimonas sp.]|nr:metal ABC transporter permease [Brevundimonas sp.]
MRGERSGRRGDVATKAMNAGADPSQQEAPPTLEALKNLIGVVARSDAPQLPWRVTGAILLTLAGKGLGVLAPLVLGAAVNHL